MHKHTNKLILETSPYLLQHAHNPVDWYPWNGEALNKAKAEDRPILVSIGYSACHWCHVMERESFEDEATARFMNEHFINIKIDREERPDLDHIYMDAVQAMTGSGGWPLNVFLTPVGKPFYGGTYFPSQNAFNRPSWLEILNSVAQAFLERRHEIEAQAENLTMHLLESNSFGLQTPSGEEDSLFTKEKAKKIFENLMKTADREWGGFGSAPKFPQTFSIQFLLRYHYTIKDTDALKQAVLSLDKMIEGGIYDQVGGGFARYSTDTEWLAPHFEKMLYDNALLVAVLCEAYQLTKNERYREVIDETMGFVQTELLQEDKGFYSALDADSEGEEGKFYVWNYEEVQEILADEAAIFCDYYDITPQGNWEQENILRIKEPVVRFSQTQKIPLNELISLLERAKKKMLTKRNTRIRPLLDDKIILAWNALMNIAVSKAFAATGNEQYRQLAIDNMHFLFEKFRIKVSNEFHHTWKHEQAKFPAFLDDYAFLIKALVHLHEITADIAWLGKAEAITGFVIDHFSEPGTSFFFYTKQGQSDIIVRKKEVYDGAIPSGNAVMASNLYRLALLLDRPNWKKRSQEMIISLEKAIIKYPSSFGYWAGLFLEIATGTSEIAIVGIDHQRLLREILGEYIPHRILMASVKEGEFPLLRGKGAGNITNIWLCRDYTCRQPVNSLAELRALIDSGDGPN
jgi:uncharacterized protein